jgi:hypothetical protein
MPSALRDLVLVGMLELSGSTSAAASMLNVSQPTASRRNRQLAQELGLQRDLNKPGCNVTGVAAQRREPPPIGMWCSSRRRPKACSTSTGELQPAGMDQPGSAHFFD